MKIAITLSYQTKTGGQHSINEVLENLKDAVRWLSDVGSEFAIDELKSEATHRFPPSEEPDAYVTDPKEEEIM